MSKDTCSFALDRFSSSKIHCRAAPIPRVVEVALDSVLRVPKPTSVVSSAFKRSTEIAATSAWMRGSADGVGAGVWARAARAAPTAATTTMA